MSIRGPIGGPRTDFYTSYLAMQIRAAKSSGELSIDSFKMPWVKLEDLEQ